MTLNELMRARDCVARMLVVLDPLSAMFAVHYKTWLTFDKAVRDELAERSVYA